MKKKVKKKGPKRTTKPTAALKKGVVKKRRTADAPIAQASTSAVDNLIMANAPKLSDAADSSGGGKKHAKARRSLVRKQQKKKRAGARRKQKRKGIN